MCETGQQCETTTTTTTIAQQNKTEQKKQELKHPMIELIRFKSDIDGGIFFVCVYMSVCLLVY